MRSLEDQALSLDSFAAAISPDTAAGSHRAERELKRIRGAWGGGRAAGGGFLGRARVSERAREGGGRQRAISRVEKKAPHRVCASNRENASSPEGSAST